MRKMLPLLGVVTGLACYYAIGWALNESALVQQIIGAGMLLWLLSAYAFAAGLAVVFVIRCVLRDRL